MKPVTRKKSLLLQIGLGVVVFIAVSGIVLGLSILFGLLKSPLTSEPGDEADNSGASGTSQIIDPELFPYITKGWRAEYSGGVILVYMFPDLSTPGTIDDKETAIVVEVESWLLSNGIDTQKVTIEYRTK